jgi:hypothetical protein
MLERTAERFIRALYDDQAGYMEIVAGVPRRDDPRKIRLVISKDDQAKNTRRWLYRDPLRPDLDAAAAHYIEALAEHYGNVYISSRLYTKQAATLDTRSEEYTKPSKVIFVDDAPPNPEIPYSFSVRTSDGSRHGYYRVDKPATKDDARRAASALGGDPSGVDLTQLVRVPGTSNTKGGGRFTVQVETEPDTLYQLADLRQRWPAAPAKASAEIANLDWPEVEQHLSNIDALLSCARSQRIKPETQTGRILAGELLTFPVNGKMDDSTSMNASAAGMGFYLRGYADDEIAAVVFHLYKKWGTLARKGTRWVRDDIGRILAYCHAQHPEVKQSPTRYRQAQPAEAIADDPPISRARKDRPRRLDPPMLFARYQADPALCTLPRKGRAAKLGISTATLDRLEDILEGDFIRIDKAGKGLPGRVVLLVGSVINIPQPDPAAEVLSAPIAEAPRAAPECHETINYNPQCIGETHPPPEAPRSLAVPSLRSLVALALDDDGRASLAKVQRYLSDNGFAGRWPAHAVKTVYEAERDRRRFVRQDAREAEKARKMSLKGLQRKGQALATAAAEYARTGQHKRAAAWRRRAGIYAAEEARRTVADQARFDAQLDQARLLADVAEVRGPVQKPRAVARAVRVEPAPAGALSGGVCSPQPTLGTVPSLLASIRAYHERRQAGAP